MDEVDVEIAVIVFFEVDWVEVFGGDTDVVNVNLLLQSIEDLEVIFSGDVLFLDFFTWLFLIDINLHVLSCLEWLHFYLIN